MQKILVVDSSPELLDLFTWSLKSDNIEVDCCVNKDSMFERLQSSIPDLLIIDGEEWRR